MLNRIKELREKQAKILTEARERNDQIGDKIDEARAKELESQHDEAMKEYDRLEGVIKREQQLIDLEKREEQRDEEQRGKKRPITNDKDEQRAQDEDKTEYRQVFHKFISAGGDVGELSSEERAVLKAGYEERSLVTATGSQGGYTVPTELADILIRAMQDWGPMYDDNVVTMLNTSSGNPIGLPTIDDTGKSGQQHTEGTDLPDDGSGDPEFGQKVLNAYTFNTPFVKVSLELAQDSIFNMENLVGDLLGERMGRIANRQLTIGTGTNAPHGIVNASSLGKLTASALGLTADELIDLYHSVNAAYRRSPKAAWQFADTTLASIRKLKDGQGNYLWQMGNIKDGSPDRILDKPYRVNDDIPAIGAGNRPIIFGDLSKYFVRKVGDPMIGVLKERFWPNLGVAGIIRVDGELGDARAIKHLAMAGA